MIRVSRAVGAALMGKRKPRVKRPKAELPENIVEKQICDFLKAHGWTLTRQHVGLFVPFREAETHAALHPICMGETGRADWMAMRPWPGRNGVMKSRNAMCELFFFETKALGKKPWPLQLRWLEETRARGFEAEWFDGLDVFNAWYRERFR